jgi:hypothetical protein
MFLIVPLPLLTALELYLRLENVLFLSPCARFIKRTASGMGIESHKTAALLVLWLSWEHTS